MTGRKLTALLFTILTMTTSLFAQEKVEMADAMRDNGRIYVVVAVVITILAGLIIYLIRLDRKMTKIEKNRSSL